MSSQNFQNEKQLTVARYDLTVSGIFSSTVYMSSAKRLMILPKGDKSKNIIGAFIIESIRESKIY